MGKEALHQQQCPLTPHMENRLQNHNEMQRHIFLSLLPVLPQHPSQYWTDKALNTSSSMMIVQFQTATIHFDIWHSNKQTFASYLIEIMNLKRTAPNHLNFVIGNLYSIPIRSWTILPHRSDWRGNRLVTLLQCFNYQPPHGNILVEHRLSHTHISTSPSKSHSQLNITFPNVFSWRLKSQKQLHIKTDDNKTEE